MNYVGMQPVLVHGGGKAINEAMETAGLDAADGHGPALHRRAHARDRRARAVQPDQQFIVNFIQSQGCEAMGCTR
jgi:acetylglutamate kinase